MKKNRRRSRKVRSNRRRSSRHSLRRNAAAMMGPVVSGLKRMVMPVGVGAAGFIAARLLSTGAAQVSGITNMLDKSDPENASNTKIAANAVGIVATLLLAPRVKFLAANQEALVVGMGLALVDRLIAKVGYSAAMGEYVNSPINGFGEYVNSPINGLGEYVNSPINGLGETYYATAGMGETYYAAAGMGETYYATAGDEIDPSDQAQIDGVMDVMEAAAGVSGDNAVITPNMSRIGRAFGLKQFVSTNTPIDVASGISRTMNSLSPVTAGPVSQEDLPSSTPGGRGYAGGVFAHNLFSGIG